MIRRGNKMKKGTVLAILEWILTGFFALCALGNGFRPSSILLVIAALLTLPVKPVRNLTRRNKIKDWYLIVAAFVLMLACAVISGDRTLTGNDFADTSSTDSVSEYTETAVESETVSDSQTDTEKADTAETVSPSETDSKKPQNTTSATESEKPQSIVNVKEKPVNLSDIPAYSGSVYVTVNDNKPIFDSNELTTVGYEKYSGLDSLGRCGVALASCGKEIMPNDGEERGSISEVYPSGWKQAKYDGISGGWLWNRCHLIGWQLSAENANRRNLITGTRYMNVDGMLPFENMVADYIKETGNHVAYRVTPIYDGDNLVCSGVQMEAYSIEDKGEGIEFNVFCYNVQPNINIDYKTGASSYAGGTEKETEKVQTTQNNSAPSANNTTEEGYILNTSTKKMHKPSCSSVKKISDKNYAESKESKDFLISQGYTPCKNCFK